MDKKMKEEAVEKAQILVGKEKKTGKSCRLLLVYILLLAVGLFLGVFFAYLF